MKVTEWKTYRTRFLVKAKQLNSSLTFTDHLGRQHCGRKGDYLVESFDGVISIAPRRIFEDIYVPMAGSLENGSALELDLSPSKGLADGARPRKMGDPTAAHDGGFETGHGRQLDLPSVRVEPLAIERIKPAPFQYASGDSTPPREVGHARRKSPITIPVTTARARLM